MSILFNISMDKFNFKKHHAISEEKVLSPREREIETIFSFGNGYIGTRNSLEELYPQSMPGSFLAGVYEQEIDEEFNVLVKIPDWTRIKIYVENNQLDLIKNITHYNTRYIDLNSGCVVRDWECRDNIGRITNIKIIKYISLFNKHEMGKYILIKPENYSGNIRVLSGIDCDSADFEYLINQNKIETNSASVLMKSKFTGKELMILQKSIFKELKSKIDYQVLNNYDGSYEEWRWHAEIGQIYEIKSIISTYLNNEVENLEEACEKHILRLGNDFFETSAQNQIKKWSKRFDESRIIITGNELDQKYLDFALFHLITAGEFSGDKYSISARGLSGEAYKGHIFWDTEIFLLPFFIYVIPEIAKNLLLYRYNTLNGARKNAENEGYKGASYAWESTDSGLEMAPSHTVLPDGTMIYILSGRFENHISSDVAYTVWKYWEATQDADFIVNYGAEILFETARYCESLLILMDDGLYHTPVAIGPDEYHERIEDNAYTNYMARNNFDIAIKAYDFLVANFNETLIALSKKINLIKDEIENWKKIKDNIYTGYDEKTKIYEQFKGFYNLKPVDLKQYEPRSMPMDVILGHENIQKTQVIKQADVLMFLYLFGENFSYDEVLANYEYYEPKCGHGSSLSPSIHSLISARLGKMSDAYKYFLQNAKIDIDNEFGNAFGGIHIASVGGVWMSVVMGFAGMHATEKGLIFNPHIPPEWENFEFSVKWRNSNLKVSLNKEQIVFFPSCALYISLGKDNWKELIMNEEYHGFLKNDKWYWKE